MAEDATALMGLSPLLDEPFFTGGDTDEGEEFVGTPRRFDVTLAGRGYMIDTRAPDGSRFVGPVTIPFVRDQSDDAGTPGEGSLTREGLWRRTVTSWHHGAGQDRWDAPDADPYRFRASRGLDVWTPGQITPLPRFEQLGTWGTFNNPTAAVTARDVIYVAPGGSTEMYRVQVDGTTDAITLTIPVIPSLATDGTFAYLGTPTGIRRILDLTATAWNPLPSSLVGFHNGRLMAAGAGATEANLYNVISASAPEVLFTHPTEGWKWTAFASGQTAIYAGGYASTKSTIYRIPIIEDGTGLDTPLVAGELPDGERVRSLTGYLGFVLIGTDEGFRLAQPNADGNLSIGPLVNLGEPVLCGIGFRDAIYFGWSRIPGLPSSFSSGENPLSGLGRASLSTFTGPLTPAYAADVFSGDDSTADTTAAIVFNGRPTFVDWSRVYMAATDPAEILQNGELLQGEMTYGVIDLKVGVQIDAVTDPLPPNRFITFATSVDRGQGYTELDQHGGDGTTVITQTLDAATTSGESIEFGIAQQYATVIRHITLQALPVPRRTKQWVVPLILHETVETRDGQPVTYDIEDEIEYLLSLVTSTTPIVEFTYGGITRSVWVEDVQQYRWNLAETERDWNATVVVRLKEP